MTDTAATAEPYRVVMPPCYCAGTRILTDNGEVPVEQVAVGDVVVTVWQDQRALMPVRWIGSRRMFPGDADPMPAPPVRIRAGALGEGLPMRDLLVSPCHAVFVGGVLVQASALVNGMSVVREAGMPDGFVYYHIELDEHALLLAEGAPAESFVDNIDRISFDNHAEHAAIHPAGRAITEMPLPRVMSARQVPMAVRRLLRQRAEAIGGTGREAA